MPKILNSLLKSLKNVHFCSKSRKPIILTAGIPFVCRGSKFEADAEVGQKGAFCKGFTLIEVISVTTIIGIVSVFTFLFIVNGISAYVDTVDNAVLAQKANLALSRITKELAREMVNIDTLTGATSAKTHIKYMIQKNPAVYRHIGLVGTASRKDIVLVERDTPVPADTDDEVLVDGVSAFTMEFKQYDGSEWTVSDIGDPDKFENLARIIITLTLFNNDVDTDTTTFTTSVTPPNTNEVVSEVQGLDPIIHG